MFKLSRVTTSGKWQPEIDGLRCVAIVTVLACHLLERRLHAKHLAPELVAYSGLIGSIALQGVQLFFVISGYILAQPLLRAYVNTGTAGHFKLWPYYRRRLTRIEPPYILALFISFGVFMLAFPNSVRWAVPQLAQRMFYVSNFFHNPSQINGAMWSLEIEVQFYLLAPLFGQVYRLRSNAVRWAIWLAAIGVAIWMSDWIQTAADPLGRFRISLPLVLTSFLMGMFAADLVGVFRDRWKHALWDVAALVAWPAVFYAFPLPYAHWTIPFVLLTCFMSTLLGPIGKKVLGYYPVAIMGGMCYSFYLLHLVCYQVFGTADDRYNHIHQAALSIAATAAIVLTPTAVVCILFYVTVERPCMNPNWPHDLARWCRTKLSPSSQMRSVDSINAE